MLDLKISGGLVLDGGGTPAARADVGIRGGRVAVVGDLRDEPATQSLDAQGLCVAPGFIDIHAHDDFNLLVNPAALGKVMQGVTTVVNGNCGLSPAPVAPERRDTLRDLSVELDSGLDYGWRTMGEFLARQPAAGVNACQLVGHHALRCAVMGMEDRAPSPRELEQMRALLAEGMEAGAFGLSTGLVGPPSSYAALDELVALAEVAAGAGGGYFTHLRNEGAEVVQAIREALEIGRRAPVPVQISHLKISNPDHWGIAGELLTVIERARQGGVRVHCDQYPYTASSGGLRARLPRWAQAGEREAILARLRDPAARERLRDELNGGMARAGVSMRIYRWEDVLVGASPSRPEFVGLTLAQVAQREGQAPADAMLDLLLADGLATMGIYFHMGEADVRRILVDPHVAVGSDGLYTGRPGEPDRTNPHPRHYGTFARVLGRYVREEGVLALPEAVRKMTALPADILGLADRGRLRAGAAADVVVFDAATIIDQATFAEPHRYPRGVHTVLVNGTAVVRQGRETGATPGRVLR